MQLVVMERAANRQVLRQQVMQQQFAQQQFLQEQARQQASALAASQQEARAQKAERRKERQAALVAKREAVSARNIARYNASKSKGQSTELAPSGTELALAR
jgi:hypothetical protein